MPTKAIRAMVRKRMMNVWVDMAGFDKTALVIDREMEDGLCFGLSQ